MNGELRFTIEPDWREVERINTQAMEFLGGAALPETAIDTYTMVICELMENSIKYGRADGRIDVIVSLTGEAIDIQVANKVAPEAHLHLQELDRTLQWIRGVQDPYQAYLERVREISREPLSDARSGLGLARIVYEGSADVDFVLGEDDTLNVSAMARLG